MLLEENMKLIEYIAQDNIRGLMPLRSTALLAELGEAKIREYLFSQILSANDHASFLPSPVVYALKDKFHARKILQLDPVSAFYIYDFTHRNSASFQKDKTPKANKKQYGYSFDKNNPVNSLKEYHAFRMRKYDLKKEYKYYAKVDIANCFNSFYHHDVVSFISRNINQPESEQLGQFLREINSGRSVNCFPQGIFPAKVIGNFFLNFIEGSLELKSSAIIRYLDDVFLFSNNLDALEQDVLKLQSIIGERCLALNPEKTKFGSKLSDFEERKLDKIQKSLMRKREFAKDYDGDEDIEVELEPKEIEYLKSLLNKKNSLAEEDVELVLALLKSDQSEASYLIELVLSNYPSLTKNLYQYMSDINDNGEIWGIVKQKIAQEYIHEFELFWITRIIIDRFCFGKEYAEILLKIFNHRCSTPIIQAAILEVENNNFGLYELKEVYLRNSSSSIPAACAVVGLLKFEKAKRNQVYKYAGNGSNFMHLVCDICTNN